MIHTRREAPAVRSLRWLARTRAGRRTILPLVARVLARRRRTIRGGAAAGLRISIRDSNPAYVFGLSEPHVQRTVMEALEAGSVFFDVGANVGFFTMIGARAVRPGGHVYAFEPHPTTRAVLEQNVVHNRLGPVVSLLPWALGENAGTALLTAHDPFRAHLSPHGELRVEVRRLDDLDLPAPDLVKVDVEGAEASVLRGMPRILARNRPTMIVETHDHSTAVEQMLRAACYDIIRPEGERMPHIVARPGRTHTSVSE